MAVLKNGDYCLYSGQARKIRRLGEFRHDNGDITALKNPCGYEDISSVKIDHNSRLCFYAGSTLEFILSGKPLRGFCISESAASPIMLMPKKTSKHLVVCIDAGDKSASLLRRLRQYVPADALKVSDVGNFPHMSAAEIDDAAYYTVLTENCMPEPEFYNKLSETDTSTAPDIMTFGYNSDAKGIGVFTYLGYFLKTAIATRPHNILNKASSIVYDCGNVSSTGKTQLRGIDVFGYSIASLGLNLYSEMEWLY